MQAALSVVDAPGGLAIAPLGGLAELRCRIGGHCEQAPLRLGLYRRRYIGRRIRRFGIALRCGHRQPQLCLLRLSKKRVA